MTDGRHTLYRVWYGDELVYIGCTSQPLDGKLHQHFFKSPKLRKLDLAEVTRIESAECATDADMNLYATYYVNKHRPRINCENTACSEVTVTLPSLEWEEYEIPRIEEWRKQIEWRDSKYKENQEDSKRWFLKACSQPNRETFRRLKSMSENIAGIPW